jgi:hypothetical protein
MTLQPFFSLTPLNPRIYTYSAAQPDAPYASAYLVSYGGVSCYYSPCRLTDQYSNDELVLGFDPVDPADQTIVNFYTAFYSRNAIRFYFRGTNVSTENQYLLLFSLRGLYRTPIVQFFVGTTLVRSEELKLSGYEQVAILMDVPGNDVAAHVNLRLASSEEYSMFAFKGMDCYLL